MTELESLNAQLGRATADLENTKVVSAERSRKIGIEIECWRVIGFFAMGLGAVFFFAPFALPDRDVLAYNEYGDFVGGVVSSLWSFAGLIFIYIAFLGQKQQMTLQQLDLRHTHLEMLATRIQIIAQSNESQQQTETFRLQQFETTFFNMLVNLNKVIDSLQTNITEWMVRIDDGPDSQSVSVTGEKCFKKLFQEIYSNIDGFFSRSETPTDLEAFDNIYFYSESRQLFRPFFTTLTILLDYIDQWKFSDNPTENDSRKRHYFNIVVKPLSFMTRKAIIYHIAICKDAESDYNKRIKEIEGKYKLMKDTENLEVVISYDHYILARAGIHDFTDYPDYRKEDDE